MSEKCTASCTCGYSQNFAFGSPSGFQPHNKSNEFSYRCMLCGIVPVDVAADELVCPRGSKHKIVRMGGSGEAREERLELAQSAATTASFLQRVGIRKPDILPQPAKPLEPILSVNDHELYDEPYYCPFCRKTELRFRYSGYYAA